MKFKKDELEQTRLELQLVEEDDPEQLIDTRDKEKELRLLMLSLTFGNLDSATDDFLFKPKEKKVIWN